MPDIDDKKDLISDESLKFFDQRSVLSFVGKNHGTSTFIFFTTELVKLLLAPCSHGIEKSVRKINLMHSFALVRSAETSICKNKL
jgi:hypothetical protein